MTLGRALEKCAFESRWLTGHEPWGQRLAWNLTMAALLRQSASVAYHNGIYDSNELLGVRNQGQQAPALLGPYPRTD